jgi:CO dehydrogenase/acetyl-CoA synthase alpha subunit
MDLPHSTVSKIHMADEAIKVASIFVVSTKCCNFELGRLESMADWDRSNMP